VIYQALEMLIAVNTQIFIELLLGYMKTLTISPFSHCAIDAFVFCAPCVVVGIVIVVGPSLSTVSDLMLIFLALLGETCKKILNVSQRLCAGIHCDTLTLDGYMPLI